MLVASGVLGSLALASGFGLRPSIALALGGLLGAALVWAQPATVRRLTSCPPKRLRLFLALLITGKYLVAVALLAIAVRLLLLPGIALTIGFSVSMVVFTAAVLRSTREWSRQEQAGRLRRASPAP